MLPLRHLTASLLLLASLIAAPAARAETYNTCAGFIDSLPATITTQGTWCLRHDLSTAITNGHAITINTNNVTIDCNNFKLGGLAAGAGTLTDGIYASNRTNATVRHCNIRGFQRGANVTGTGGGHVFEDNRFDASTYRGIEVQGDGSVVRRNHVIDTGGSSAVTGFAYGIFTYDAVDVLDNTVTGVLPTATLAGNGNAIGIYTAGNPNGSISGNRVRGLVKLGTGTAQAIYNAVSGRISLRGNDLSGDGSAASVGLRCHDSSGSAKDNIISGFVTAMSNCTDSGGNAVIP